MEQTLAPREPTDTSKELTRLLPPPIQSFYPRGPNPTEVTLQQATRNLIFQKFQNEEQLRVSYPDKLDSSLKKEKIGQVVMGVCA